MIISHNLQALNTNRLANANISALSKSTEKVSSGYKINHVGDNPVGIAMSETMRRQVRGLNQGIENTKAAINFCQVADGALSEVTEMLQRLNKLSVQAENGTNTLSDRHDIQAEVEQLLAEIDRISDVTTFNEIPVFRGEEKIIQRPGTGGGPITDGDIPFEDFSIADVSLGQSPFGPSSSGYHLNLQAVVNNADSPAHGNNYALLYGSSARPSFRLTYEKEDGTTQDSIVQFSTGQPNEYAEGIDSDGHSWWQRSFEYTNDDDIKIKITQHVTAVVPEDMTQEKYYALSYSIDNMSDSKNVTLDFMFHADTAYGGNREGDRKEDYFVTGDDGNGNRLGNSCIFTDGGNWSGSAPVVPADITNDNVHSNLPDSFSIINTAEALAFSEKISFLPDSKPNVFSFGHYSSVGQWNNYYNNLNSLLNYNVTAGYDQSKDLGFSLFWNRNINAGDTSQISFHYGIVSRRNDNNLSNVEINGSTNIIGGEKEYYEKKDLWIQTGYEKGSGLWLEIDEMNTEVLGIDKLDLTTIEGAADANTRVKEALHKLSISRSKIGAQQNRLEHTVANEENISEQVSGAESSIRDTDLSSEMVRYSNLSVLLQMGQTMIAEADQRIEKLLTILQ